MNLPATETPHVPSRLLALALSLVLLLVGSALGIAVQGDRTLFGDVGVLEFAQSIEAPGLGTVVTAVNTAGGSLGGVIMALSLMAIGFAVRRPDFSAQVALVFVLRILGEALKPIFESPRPGKDFLRFPGDFMTTHGYPSGHTFTYTCIGGLLIVLALSLDLRRMWQVAIIALGVILPILGGFARVWTGVHWPYDVVGGFLFGSAALLLSVAIVPIRPIPRSARPPSLAQIRSWRSSATSQSN